MKSLTCAARLAPLFAALLLGGCVTAEVVSVDTTATAVPVATRGPDEPRDDLTLGKEHFRARHYGLAEMHFRRAVESRKDDAEAWLGLAAAYDELKRYRLADRAYAQALKLIGPTPEFLNNRGYSSFCAAISAGRARIFRRPRRRIPRTRRSAIISRRSRRGRGSGSERLVPKR